MAGRGLTRRARCVGLWGVLAHTPLRDLRAGYQLPSRLRRLRRRHVRWRGASWGASARRSRPLVVHVTLTHRMPGGGDQRHRGGAPSHLNIGAVVWETRRPRVFFTPRCPPRARCPRWRCSPPTRRGTAETRRTCWPTARPGQRAGSHSPCL